MKLETSETIRDDVRAEAWRVLEQGGAPLSHRALAERALQALRDIDTLLAEVGRLRTALPAPPLQVTRDIIVWNEPVHTQDPLISGVMRMHKDDAVKWWRLTHSNYDKASDEEVLADFIAVHWAWREPPASPLSAEVEKIVSTLRWLSGDDSGKFTEGDKSVLLRAASLLSRWPGVWKPIETAPKDGMILLFAVTARNDDGKVSNWKMGSGIWLPGYADHITLSPWEWSGRQLHKYETHPTHWSPLPEPPHE